MGRFVIIIGMQWGDEGKGKIVDLLTSARPPWPDSRVDTMPAIRSSSAVARPFSRSYLRHPARGVQCLIGNGVVLSLEALFREADMLRAEGVPVFERLRISPACPLILPSHVVLDRAREAARGMNAIGTTGRGIGPAYEDKVARRAVRVADLFQRDRFAAKLGEVLDFHNFVLQRYFALPPVDFQRTLDEQLEYVERVRPLLCDVTGALSDLRTSGANVLFEGAQGAMLDVDVGTYPFVTSSNTTAGAPPPAPAWGRARSITCSVSSRPIRPRRRGPFPTELFDDDGEHLSRVGHEFGSVTGRRRRCGWFDAVALRRSIIHSSVSGLCVTKLDVLDGLETIRLCVGYRVGGETLPGPPLFADAYADVEPVYEEMPGWQDSTVGVREHHALPLNARRYLERIEQLLACHSI